MKFAHISDIHLGYSSGRKRHPNSKINLREQDGHDALEYCISQIIEHKPDFVLCTGDFFHSPLPSIHNIVKAQEQLRRLYEAGIPFYNIAGNHDSTDSVSDIPSNRVLHIPEMNLFSFTEPYKIIDIGDIRLHMVSHHGYIMQKETLNKVEPTQDKFNILVSHGSVYDESIMAMLHSDSEPREIVIPEEFLKKGWDYVLLGHIHERRWVSSQSEDIEGKIFYGGSLIRRGFSDKECKLGRGWTLWEKENSTIKPKFFTCPQRPQYDINLDCYELDIVAIEQKIAETFKDINFDDSPILRLTLENMEKSQKTLINWKQFEEDTTKCLTFSPRIITLNEKKINNFNTGSSGFSLLDSYSEYWEESKENYKKEKHKEIEATSKDYLKAGQDTILSKE